MDDADLNYWLVRWGEWRRNQHSGLSLSRETTLYRAMAGKVRLSIPWRPEGFCVNDMFIDTDRRIAALPDKLKRVLITEFVIGGDVRAKTAAADMPTSSYYRALNRAKRGLREGLVS